MTKDQELAASGALQTEIGAHNSRCSVAVVGPLPEPEYSACKTEETALNAQRAALTARLADFGIDPDTPHGGTTGTDLNTMGTQIGAEITEIPKGGGQTQTLADRVNALHLSQNDAAQVTDIASQRAFGGTAGIASLPMEQNWFYRGKSCRGSR